MSFPFVALAQCQNFILLDGDPLASKPAFPKLPLLVVTFPLPYLLQAPASPVSTYMTLGKLWTLQPVFSLSSQGLDTIRKEDVVMQVPGPLSEAPHKVYTTCR